MSARVVTRGRQAAGIRRRWTGGALLAVALLAGALLAGCAPGAPTTLTAHAGFPDIGTLAPNAPVELADITVGHVSGMHRVGDHASVDLTINRSAHVPVDVSAHLTQTSLIGETIVSLQPAQGQPTTPLLADGATISNTQVDPGVEQLVQAGTNFIGSLSANDLATSLQEGAQAFGDQGPALHQFIDNFNTVVAGYAQHSAALTQLINNVAQVSAQLAPSAQANAQALSNFATTTKELNDQSNRLEGLLTRLSQVSTNSVSLIGSYLPQITDNFNGLLTTVNQLSQHQSQLSDVLGQFPIFLKESKELTHPDQSLSQIPVVFDTITCGLPTQMGGSDPNNPLTSCHGAG
jgi:phospholipid/cholesterol/gamma-HCH transport system substrate-binding protein